MSLRAGDLNRRIRIDARAPETIDALGTPVPGWTEIAARWAQWTPVRDAERFAGGQEVQATVTDRFVVRWDAALWAALDPTCRIRFDGRIWDVIAVKPIGLRVGIEISATARAER